MAAKAAGRDARQNDLLLKMLKMIKKLIKPQKTKKMYLRMKWTRLVHSAKLSSTVMISRSSSNRLTMRLWLMIVFDNVKSLTEQLITIK